jgi:hypothetical protein
MKTTRIFVAILAITLLSVGKNFASENASVNAAKENLKEQIQKVFNTTPMEDLINEPNEVITVVFKINKDHQFELIQVKGDNERLVNYSKRILASKKIVADPLVESKAYTLPVLFKTE